MRVNIISRSFYTTIILYVSMCSFKAQPSEEGLCFQLLRILRQNHHKLMVCLGTKSAYGQPEQLSEILSLKQIATKINKGYRCVSSVEHLLYMHEALGSVLNSTKITNKSFIKENSNAICRSL